MKKSMMKMMKNSMNKSMINSMRKTNWLGLFLFAVLLLAPVRAWSVGWTPTDGGLVVDLQTGDRFLLSIWLDLDKDGVEDAGEEFFVINYNRYTGGHFNYSDGLYLKLAPQAGDATEPSDMSIWSAGAPLSRIIGGLDYSLGANAGQVYTIWNDGKTLKTYNDFQFLGDLTSDYNDTKACDVVFVIPTNHEGITSFDPNKTLTNVYGRTDQLSDGRINGRIGRGFLGMTYREVYMLNIPRQNKPVSYTNASVVTFNTTNKQQSWSNGQIKCDPGHAAYAFADDKHKPTHRTLFRLYLLDRPFPYCSSFYFATDEQDVKKYRWGPDTNVKPNRTWTDSTAEKKIYTIDWMYPMKRDGSTEYHKTDYMTVPIPDSTYYYVGWNNDYRKDAETLGSGGAKSQFEKIRELPLSTMPEFKAPAGAYGQMIVDTTSTDFNLGVAFEPAGYFLKIKETGTNVRMHQTSANTWLSEEMWTISGYYASLHIRTMLMTGSDFNADDPGAAVEGWSKWVRGDSVPTSDGKSIVDKSGYAQITVNNTDSNGHMVFILADNSKWIRYHNNGFMGLEMPKQYPLADGSDLTIMEPRIKSEYTFLGWNTKADGSGDTLKIGDKIDLKHLPDGISLTGDSVLNLYALAKYEGTLQMAISFMRDGKRYFITHPNTSTPRVARARHFEHWENTWQGMENAENEDPNYLSTFELRSPVNEIKKKDVGITEDLRLQEHALDPRQYTMKGYTDSLTFYEFFHPNDDEYLGLYYEESFNTILANNTWAGLFTTTSTATELSWPNYMVPYIKEAKIKSTRYVEEYDHKNKPDSLILKARLNARGDTIPAYVKYDASTDQFNGVATEGEATAFDISAVIVADEHYIILPDTSYAWKDTIDFGYHKNEQLREDIWSALIGKQLMAVMMLDRDTVYFHPNRKKIISDPNDLYLSPDFRVTQIFEWIPDSRVSAPLNEGDSAQSETTDHYWHHNIVSGLNSPMNVKNSGGQYINIADTFRIHMSHDAVSKIKEYRGRWKAGSAGLKVDNANGSMRHRDIIVRTKTYHSSDTLTRYALKPEKESYNFGPLNGQTNTIQFTLTRETYHDILDTADNKISEKVIQVDTLTKKLGMLSDECSFNTGAAYAVNAASDSIVTLRVTADNTINTNYDTLIISSINVDGVATAVEARVPLVQAALTTNELVWSVYDESAKKRYFIMAVNNGSSTTLQFREFTQANSMLYEQGTKNQLVKGSNAGNNSDGKYITPWTFDYDKGDKNKFSLKTEYGISKYFATDGGTGTTLDDDRVLFTYRIAEVNTNDNSNYEEKVRIKYLDDKWLKFNGTNIVLQEDSASATVFSWTYLITEYNLLNNGDYPSLDEVSFGYNIATPKSIQTRYKAYREYSMLLDNSLTYLCHKEETRTDSLQDAAREWKTTFTIDTIRDRRTATLSGIDTTYNRTTLTTMVRVAGDSPTEVKDKSGNYIDIVDTLRVTLSLKDGAQTYRFKGDWSGFKSISDANLKIPLIRKTYHEEDFYSLNCAVEGDDENFTFPATITPGDNDSHDYILYTFLHEGTRMVDVDGNVVAITSERFIDVTEDHEGKGGDKDTVGMHLNNKLVAEVRLMDIYGDAPDWCEIDTITSDTVTIKCTKNGIRSPRTAYLYLAYIVVINGDTRFVNRRLTVSQASYFEYANNQTLVHSHGASGDEKMENGMQQVHTNKRILYYYPDQDVELPVRERAFYGWWRWYREGVDVDSVDVSDSDIPDSLWRSAPRNAGLYTYPYRIIGDSVDDGAGGKKLVTMGRWTVFHYKSKDYKNKQDPPAKNPTLVPPDTMRVGINRGKHPVVTYVADISNYYDKLPMSLKVKNQIDTALMDTMRQIIEPTLSLREVFELHPWTEMAEKLENYKDTIGREGSAYRNMKYMEDHTIMAPTGAPLLLTTEQRYSFDHLKKHGHSESLLGYYMRDDNWSTMSSTKDASGWSRQDSMIWCGGWDAECKWYTYNPKTKEYTLCTHPVSEEEDFLKVPAKGTGAVDTVYYCLRARSKSTTGNPSLEPGTPGAEATVDGGYWFNICRYKIIYHSPNKYGPLKETKKGGVTKALITKEDIEQRYDVLERLDFDYIQPGPDYHVYPHPLPWGDASYGYTYPETSSLPHNRYHDESDFPNHGEYGLINRIPYSSYWRKMEQHGGAANGYMIYCDGMASAGQVAALTLSTNLCAGQKMFFSGYVGNPSSQTGKSNPNFIFSVQGSVDGDTWDDITSYMTGDIPPASEWYQIYFPILHNDGSREYTHFRVRIYNVAADFDGNDFIIDDMCIFATKPPLIAYQAQTTCNDYGHSDEETHVLLRVDYQGITGEGYNDTTVCYTVRQKTPAGEYEFIKMTDGYIDEAKTATGDTLYGRLFIPAKDYEPKTKDSIYKNMNDLLDRFDTTMAWHKENAGIDIVREGYIYEILEGDIRPVKYVVHSAKMLAKNDYTVHMSGVPKELLSSICGMTSHLKISNRMVLELNGEEQPETEQLGLCANATYDISLRVKGSMYLDSVAPIDVTGSCVNDWLLYGDTARTSSKKRYGYYYSDIEKVVKDILRQESVPSRENPNQLVENLASVDSAVMREVKEYWAVSLDTSAHPYTILEDLVNKGFLTLYQPQLTASVLAGDSLQYVIFPIVGSGSKEMTDARVEVCPNPILIKLKPDKGGGVPLMVGGLNRDSTEAMLPVNVLATAVQANGGFKMRIDSIMSGVGIYAINLRATDDPNYREGVHRLSLEPDKSYPSDRYYVKGDSMLLRPASSNNYTMKAGYNYTFDIVMQTLLGQLKTSDGCEVGTVPFIVSIVPDYVRWEPQSASNNNWNDANNWLGIDENNKAIHNDAHFVPMENTMVVIPKPDEGKPYPVIQPLPTTHEDSVQKVNFQYNQCGTIRFLPEAAIGNQQYINSEVVIDMKLPHNKWAFRTAPVKGMLSGDLFMSNADLNNETPLWEVGEFDASGRNYRTGNGSFWLSVYNTETHKINHTGDDSIRNASADWSKVTNALTLPLEEGKGLAIYTYTKSEKDAIIRLPKDDDTYYYYGTYGERVDSKYEGDLRTKRQAAAGTGTPGDLIYRPATESQSFELTNGVESTSFVFGNPTMGFIDIWGFIADNSPLLEQTFDYMDESNPSASLYTVESRSSAEETPNTLTNLKRYLPPMHVIVLKAKAAATSLTVGLDTSRVVTDVSQVKRPLSAPRRVSASGLSRGIMTVTAKNPCSPRCTSRLLIGQGYHDGIRDGEDAILTTVNIDNYTNNSAPATPFNLYALEGGYGLSIDLRDEVVNIPIAFCISDLPYEPVTNLWFTGVNNIDGQLVLYDEWTDTERRIIDGICLTIETPTQSHQKRYYIRRPGYTPDEEEPITTEIEPYEMDDEEQAIKIIKDDHVWIIRNGHIYTMFGQKVR